MKKKILNIMYIKSIFVVTVLLMVTFSTMVIAREDVQKVETSKQDIKEEASVQYSVEFAKEDLAIIKENDYNIIKLNKCNRYTDTIGGPLLPELRIKIALPPNFQPTDIKIINTENEQLKEKFNIFPVQSPTPTDGVTKTNFVEPKQELYSSSKFFPEFIADLDCLSDLYGQRMAEILINPIQYKPSTGEIIFYKNITFELTGIDDPVYGDYLHKNLSEIEREKCLQRVQNMVYNPKDVILQKASGDTTNDQSRHSIPSGEYDLVIITSLNLYSSFKNLADWKNRKGVKTIRVYTNQIAGWIDGANDLNVEINTFIDEVYDDWGARYFLIGGDIGHIPCYYTPVTYVDPDTGLPTEESIPNDTVYSNVDSDYVCEAYVGRIPASYPYEVEDYTSKLLTYEKNIPTSNYVKTAGLFGFDLSNDPEHPEYHEGRFCKEDECRPEIPSGWTINTEYDNDGSPHNIAVRQILQNGVHFANHIDHSNAFLLGTGIVDNENDYMNCNYLTWLTNGGARKYNIMYSTGCYPVNFIENDCIGECYVLDPDGGGIAIISNTMAGWYTNGSSDTLSCEYDKYFCEKFFNSNVNLGTVFADHKSVFNPGMSGFNCYIYYTLTLLGDPEVPIWEDDPLSNTSYTVTHPESIEDDQQSITIRVKDYPNDLKQATVCLYQKDHVHEVGITNNQGLVTFSINPVAGDLYVTVTKTHRSGAGNSNSPLQPYLGTIEVVGNHPPDPPSPIRVEGYGYDTEITIGIDETLNFRTQAHDDDTEDRLNFRFDFNYDNGVYGPGWTDSECDPNTFCSWVPYTFEQVGTFEVRAQAKDQDDAESDWSEYLITVTVTDNEEPCAPIIEGDSSVHIDEQYECIISAEDLDGDDVFYWVNWNYSFNGNSGTPDWDDSGTYGPSEWEWHAYHYFPQPGTYEIEAYAYDGELEGERTYKTINVENNPPNPPVQPWSDGQTSEIYRVVIGYPTLFKTYALDPDDHNVKIVINWGDNSNSGWLGPVASGATVSSLKTWTAIDTFEVKARAKDQWNYDSVPLWSNPRYVEVYNEPPVPEISGLDSVCIGHHYTYDMTATDPNDHDVQVRYNWGDGPDSTWTLLQPSPHTFSRGHTWTQTGDVTISLQARDEFGDTQPDGTSNWIEFPINVYNTPPEPPTDPNPVDEETFVDRDIDLTWSCLGDPDGHSVTYDVYFGTDHGNLQYMTTTSNEFYDPGLLDHGTTYYWQIIVKDEWGLPNLIPSPIWSFSTEIYFIHLSDIHYFYDPAELLTNAWERFTYEIYDIDNPPQFILCSGDLVDFGAGTEGGIHLDHFKELLYLYNNDWCLLNKNGEYIPIIFTPGNHDVSYRYVLSDEWWFDGPDTTNWQTMMYPDLCFKREYHDCVIFSMYSGYDDPNPYLPTSILPWEWPIGGHLPESDGIDIQYLGWLNNELSQVSDDKYTIIIQHHPYINPNGDGILWTTEPEDGCFNNNKDWFRDICLNHNIHTVDYLLTGHTHANGGDILQWDLDGNQWNSGSTGIHCYDGGSWHDYETYTRIPISQSRRNRNDRDILDSDETIYLDSTILFEVMGNNTIDVYDQVGRHTGLDENGERVFEIPGSRYSNWDFVDESQDINYTISRLRLSKDHHLDYNFYINGEANDNLNLSIITNSDEGVCTEAHYFDVPMFDGSIASVNADDSIVDYTLSIDDPGSSEPRVFYPDEYEGNNYPPDIPYQPTGSTEGYLHTSYKFLTNTSDPDGNQVSYQWDWGDGTTSDWIGPFESDESILTINTWQNRGIFNIRVRAKDQHDCMTKWSAPLTIEITAENTFVNDNYNETTEGWQQDHFNKIQDGINAVAAKGTVFVFDGIYEENLVIRKSLNLTKTHLGQAVIKAKPVIRIGGPHNTQLINNRDISEQVFPSFGSVTIHIKNSNNVNISGFTIKDGTYGIVISSSSGVNIKNNLIKKNKQHSVFGGVNYYTKGAGLLILNSENLCINNNEISENIWGIILTKNSNIMISENYIHSNFNEEYLMEEQPRFPTKSSGGGLFLINSENNIIRKNDIIGDYIGIYSIQHSNANLIYHNTFYRNIFNAYDTGENRWNYSYPSGGNYWEDYNGNDYYSGPGQDEEKSDGIGDIPYILPTCNNFDYYPYINQNSWINAPPDIPEKPNGTIEGYTGIEYNFTTSSFDPDGDLIYYTWQFEDDNNITSHQEYESGEIASYSWTWTQVGTYYVKVYSLDSINHNSDWSETHEIVIRKDD